MINLTNYTMANNPLDMVTAINQESGYVLGVGILVLLGVIIFVGFKTVSDFESATISSMFLILVLGLMFSFLNLIPNYFAVPIIFMFLLTLGINIIVGKRT